jgi:hypothetical protein
MQVGPLLGRAVLGRVCRDWMLQHGHGGDCPSPPPLHGCSVPASGSLSPHSLSPLDLPSRGAGRMRRKGKERGRVIARQVPRVNGCGKEFGGLCLGATARVEAQIWANKNGGEHPNRKWGT